MRVERGFWEVPREVKMLFFERTDPFETPIQNTCFERCHVRVQTSLPSESATLAKHAVSRRSARELEREIDDNCSPPVVHYLPHFEIAEDS